MGLKNTRCNSQSRNVSTLEISLWYKLTHEIWRHVLRNHPNYTRYDLEDNTPGYERDPITKDVCLKAQELLNVLFKRHLLSINVEVIPTPDGELEFEWWTNIVDGGFSITISVEPHEKDCCCCSLYAGPFEDGKYRSIQTIDEVESIIIRKMVRKR